MELLDDPSLSYWRSFGDWGFKLVILGVIGEVLAGVIEKFFAVSFEKYKPRWKLFEIISGAILVVGLAMEYGGHKYETNILDDHNAKFHKEAADASKEAEEAKKQAGEANERAAKFDADRAMIAKQAEEIRSTNLVLLARVLELEGRTAPRKLTGQQVASITASLDGRPRGTIVFNWMDSDPESSSYKAQIKKLFEELGYDVKDGSAYIAVAAPPVGLELWVSTNPPPHAIWLLRAFASAGMEAHGFTGSSVETNIVRIEVGLKPPH